MITEGIGRKAPQPYPMVMTGDELRHLYHVARERAEHRGYKARADKWGQGIKCRLELPGIGSLSSAERPIYTGLCGEYAVQQYVARRFPMGHTCVVDTRLLKGGDFGIDLTAYGMRMQVKTRQKMANVTLYKRANRHGYRFSMPAHVCVFCEWREQPLSTTYIVGWQWASVVEQLPLVQSQIGDWWNAEVTDELLLPIASLRDELEAWRLARQWH